MDKLDLSAIAELEAISARTREILDGVKAADGIPDEAQAQQVGEARAHIDVAIGNLVGIAEYLTAALDSALLAGE